MPALENAESKQAHVQLQYTYRPTETNNVSVCRSPSLSNFIGLDFLQWWHILIYDLYSILSTYRSTYYSVAY